MSCDQIRQLRAQPGLGSSAQQVLGAGSDSPLAQAWGRIHCSDPPPTTTELNTPRAGRRYYSSGGGAWVCLHSVIGWI